VEYSETYTSHGSVKNSYRCALTWCSACIHAPGLWASAPTIWASGYVLMNKRTN